MRLKTNNIESTTIDGAAKEIEENHMNFVQHVCEKKGWAIADAIEEIATHIVMTDTDFIISEYMEVFTKENTGGNFTKEQIEKMNDNYNNEYELHGQEVEFDKILFEFHLDDAKKTKSFVKDYHNGDNDKLTRML